MFGGAVVSVAITSTIGGWALSRYGIGVASVCCACVIILISGFLLISRERVGERLLPWTKGHAIIDPLVHAPETFKAIALDLGKFVLLRASLFAVAAAIIYQFGRGIFLAMMPIYYVQELGWTDVSYSGLTGTATFIGGTVSILFGGLLLDFLGRTRAFQILCVAAAALGVMLAVAPGLGDSDTVMKIYRVLYMTLDTLITVAFIATAMAICARQVAATQFAIYMALSNVGYSAGSAAFGPLYQSLASFEAVFLVFTGVVIAAAVTMRQVSIADHIAKVRKLEVNEK
jgi:PAT family beta-lactamase induction signal transducer AmpG